MATVKFDFHGVMIANHPSISISNYLIVISTLVDLKTVKSFGKITGNIYCAFFSNGDDHVKLLSTEQITVNGIEIRVQDYIPSVQTIFIKGVPILEDDKHIIQLLSQYGQLKSKPVRLPLKDVQPEFSHIMSHTVVNKIVLSEDVKLPPYTKVDLGNDVVKVKIECGSKRCFSCGERGHEKKLCPKNKNEFPKASNPTKEKVPKNANAKQNIQKVSQKDPWSAVVRGGRVKMTRTRAESGLDSLSQETSPTSQEKESKAPRIQSNIEPQLRASYQHWKNQTIGNVHLTNEKLLELLIEGCDDINIITNVVQKYTTQPSLLRSQLSSLIGEVDNDMKKLLKTLVR